MIWECNSHPLLSHLSGDVGRVLVYMHNTESSFSRAFYRHIKDVLKLPPGTDKGVKAAGLRHLCKPCSPQLLIISAGFFRMVPGDFLFARDVFGSGDLLDDNIQAWVLPECVYLSTEHGIGMLILRLDT